MSNQSLLQGCQWIGTGTWETRCGEPCVTKRRYCPKHLWHVYQKDSQTHNRKNPKTLETSVEYWENLFEQAVLELELEQSL
jgi:hypothetical protein